MWQRIFATWALPALLLLAGGPAAVADEVQVAVAANFTGPMQKLARRFEQKTGHRTLLAFGSVGKFYAQITNGAPFEVLISADEETPARLEKEGLAVPHTRFTYARGHLVLWSATPGLADSQVLERGTFSHLAISHPKLTVYGAAAHEVMNKLGVLERLQPRLLQAETITQAYQFVLTGNAELGFVALSQVWQDGAIREGSAWIVPDNLSPPIRQDAVMLENGRNNPAAAALLDYLRSKEATEIIRSFGYSL
jgi:molybdate transport system substrate-binding protein